MNRLEKGLKLVKALGLKEGDKVKLSSGNIYTIQRDRSNHYVELYSDKVLSKNITNLIDADWEKAEKLGDKRCCEYQCEYCPLSAVRYGCVTEHSRKLFKQIEYLEETDPELYELLHKRLEKEAPIND